MIRCRGVLDSVGIAMCGGVSVADESKDNHVVVTLFPISLPSNDVWYAVHNVDGISPPLVQEGKVILEKALVGEENGIEGEDHIVQN